MTRRLFLAAHAHAAAIDGDLVFLDLAKDAYVCLPYADVVFDGLAVLSVSDPGTAAALLGAGLVAEAPTSGVRAPPPQLPRRSLLRDAYPPPLARDALPASQAMLDLAVAYAGRPLRAIVASARRARSAEPVPSAELAGAVDAFHRWSCYAPAPGKCLARSFLLLRRLRRQGLDALWVFGVRTWPFHAHCWLQAGDAVLDDHADRVRAYTPLMAL